MDSNLQPDQDVEDGEAIAQAHVNAVAGACLAIGIRYAGTSDAQAKATLLEHVTTYLSHKMRAPDPFTGEDACTLKLLALSYACCLFPLCSCEWYTQWIWARQAWYAEL